ncbi:spermidine synthase [Legionella adelaidensis]|nr:fused MFS/spermidine synthase [Legionella adelaidensis]
MTKYKADNLIDCGEDMSRKIAKTASYRQPRYITVALSTLFIFSLFCSALLLFIIQPVVAKILLPIYGGTPSVWTICMLFFQTLLLLSYTYVWFLSKCKNKVWRLIHIGLVVLSMVYLPIHFIPERLNYLPEFSILAVLIKQIGIPLFLLGASAPLLQFIFVKIKNNPGANPYYLYTASNAGSLLALLSYPWLIERFYTVSQQFYFWNTVYFIYLFLLLVIFLLPTHIHSVIKIEHVSISLRQKIKWIWLSFLPCSLMMGVTFYISTDVAASPLFWVLPLSLYLLSFIITFSKKPVLRHEWVVRNSLFFLIFPLIGFVYGANQIIAWQIILANLASFFMMAMLCHGELVRTRPQPESLTTFYFCLALGGLLAGLFNGIVASYLFSNAYEYPLVFLLSLSAIPIKKRNNEWVGVSIASFLIILNYFLADVALLKWVENYHVLELVALAVLFIWVQSKRSFLTGMTLLFIFIFLPWFKKGDYLIQVRNFYGVKQVIHNEGTHILMSQSTAHGFQVVNQISQGDIAYYAPPAIAIKWLQEKNPKIKGIILGVGTGLMACQFRAQDSLSLVEVDEQVLSIAQTPRLFTYLRDCPPQKYIIKEDGRLAVVATPNNTFDALILDAFNSDAIPVHLLTKEAFAIYKQKITTGGVILVNISNRHLNLLPVVLGAGRGLDLIVLHQKDPGNLKRGQFSSEWVALTQNEELAFHMMRQNWSFVTKAEEMVWTDNYSNLIPLMKW